MQWVVHKCLTGSVDLKRVEPPMKATPARYDRQHRETRKWLLKVRTIVRNNRRLTVREIADDCATFAWISSPKTTGKMVGWRLDPAPRQCTCTHFTSCAAVFGQTRHRTVAAAAILTRFHTVWLFLFPRLKKVLKGHWFEATKDIKQNSTKTLLDILKDEFAKCFQRWQQRWAKYVAAEGNYVEDN